MPELPEVETVCRTLTPHLVNRHIMKTVVLNQQVVHHSKEDGAAFSRAVEGALIKEIARRGKYILLVLDHGWVVCHLRMTGKLLVKERAYQPQKHDHLVLYLEDGKQLVYEDVRRFGGLSYYEACPNQQLPLAKLGPEPLSDSFDGEYLYQRCQNRKKPIKSFILDQSIVAGIGNIYADEILFRAGIRPLKSAYRLRKVECERLAQATKEVLSEAILAGGSTIRDYVNSDAQEGSFQLSHRVYGRAGAPCVTCGTPLKRLVVGGRSSVYCPCCQKS